MPSTHQTKDIAYCPFPPRAEKVLAFFVGKGLLVAPAVAPRPATKIDIEDVLWVIKEVEERVLEVLPAALIHFPKSFLHKEKLPPSVKEVVNLIRKSALVGPTIRGISYDSMKRWANQPLPDKRSVPADKKRILKNFRFSPKTVQQLKAAATQAGLSETEYLERLVSADAQGRIVS